MPGVIQPGQRQSSMGQLGQGMQMLQTGMQLKNSFGSQPSGQTQGEQVAPAASPAATSLDAPGANSPAARDRRIKFLAGDPNQVGGY